MVVVVVMVDGGGLSNGGLILLQLREGDLFSNMFSGKTLLVKGLVSRTKHTNFPVSLSQPFLTKSI